MTHFVGGGAIVSVSASRSRAQFAGSIAPQRSLIINLRKNGLCTDVVGANLLEQVLERMEITSEGMVDLELGSTAA